MITEKDRERLDWLIEENRVDLETLKREGLDKYANINYLYIADRVKTSELARYWNLNRSTVYRKFEQDIKEQIKVNKIIKQNGSTSVALLAPDKVFTSLSEYAEFLKWRNKNKEQHLIPVKKTAVILGISEQQIRKYINSKKLPAVKRRGTYKIPISVFELLAKEKLNELIRRKSNLINQIESINNYLNSLNEVKGAEAVASMQRPAQQVSETVASMQRTAQSVAKASASDRTNEYK